jgi:hypothetical protein
VALKIKIIKCSSDAYWYRDNIGKTFVITGNSPMMYGGFGGGEVFNDTWEIVGGNGILKEDCEIINENKPKKT